MTKFFDFSVRWSWIGLFLGLLGQDIAQATGGPSGTDPADAARPADPRDLVRRYKASVDAIRTLRAKFRVVTGRTFPGAREGLKRDDSGRVIAYEAERDWEIATRRYRLERSLLTKSPAGVFFYTPLVAAYDGKRYRGFNPDPKSFSYLGGLVSSDEEQIQIGRQDYPWIPTLLGYHFAPEPDRSLWEVLDSVKIVEVEGTEPHLVVLEATYKFHGDNETRVRAWIDTKHGCLPARVETVRLWSDTLAARIVVEEFHEFAPGLWVPVRGSIHRYFIDMVLPERFPKEDVPRLTTDELRARGVRYVAKPLGGEDGFFPDTLIVDANTLRVNQAIAPGRFVLEFPAGLQVLDNTTVPIR